MEAWKLFEEVLTQTQAKGLKELGLLTLTHIIELAAKLRNHVRMN